MRRQFLKYYDNHADSNSNSYAYSYSYSYPNAGTFLSLHAGGTHYLDTQHQQPACAHSGESCYGSLGDRVE
jgi:hypothetical protein